MHLALLLLFADVNDVESAIRKLASVYAAVEANAADKVDPNRTFYEGTIPGTLRQLDPHSVFFNPVQFDQLKEMQRSETKGFGTVVSVLPGRVIVLQALPGTPASRAGIEAGDEILAVNGIRLDWLEMEQLIELLSETRQREARLDVRRTGSPRMLQFTLKPEHLASPSVDRAFPLRDGVGYVRITSFEGNTGKLAREAVEKLGGAALRGLVLDLRNNPGGVMASALETAGLFLEPGKKLVTVRGRGRDAEEVSVPAGTAPFSFPLAVLINSKSASGSEIVAGAMQDHDRGAVIGEPSYGKGLVQSVYPLPQGSGMALTTAFYFTPSGRSIQRPLSGGQLDTGSRWANLEGQTEFRTAKGRTVRGGGGIVPDTLAWPEPTTRLRAALDATGSFVAFATEYLRKVPQVTPEFSVAGGVMDEFRYYLSQRNIAPGVSEWTADRDWIRSRLQQEIFNLSLGVEKGDEVELRRDPQVRAAMDALGLR